MKNFRTAHHFFAALLVLAAVGAAYAFRNVLIWSFGRVRWPGEAVVQQGVLTQDLSAEDVTTIAVHLNSPWSFAFLPDGRVLLSERAGKLVLVGSDGVRENIDVPGVRRTLEGGLLGIAPHPDFSQNGWIYAYSTALDARGHFENRVERYRLERSTLVERTTILQHIPAGPWGNGGVLRFGPDKKLYVSTGDAGDASLSQDLRSFGGKILRVNDDGTIPNDNPFANAIWSYGHRNVEGMAWDAEGRLWATDRGRGMSFNHDELNLIEAGKNYGWPLVRGSETSDGMVSPMMDSGRRGSWAPSGAAWYGGSVFFGTLRGEALYEVPLNARSFAAKAHFETEFGRIRAVEVGPDGSLYLLTSNTDGLGMPGKEDDRLIRLNPRLFQKAR